MGRATTVLLVLTGFLLTGLHHAQARQPVPAEHLIVPGVGVGDYALGLSKDKVLQKLGEPQAIQLGRAQVVRHGEEKYSLNDLPRGCVLGYGDMFFWLEDDAMAALSVRGPRYRLRNGLGVGDSWQSIRQVFGEDFTPREEMGQGYLCYPAQGLAFAIDEKNQAVTEIVVYRPKGPGTANPGAQGSRVEGPRVLKTLPRYDPNSGNPSQVSLQGCDLSKLDLRASRVDLLHADFDDRTVWPAPDRIPSDFDWRKIMELGKNPGLGVRRVHEKGITGRGVKLAIIDQPLLVDHQEYAGRVRLYEEVDLQGRREPTMHGAAVASIALGKTVGVAPEAELYYIAMHFIDQDTLRRLARCVHRILELNEQLPKNNKIRAISISKGWMPAHEGYKEITDAVQKAQTAGILVVRMGSDKLFDFGTLGRSPLADPDVFESYEPGLFWAKRFWARPSSPSGVSFSVPMDSRATASPAGISQYAFYRIGGMSWAAPYVAGMYALAVQADPAITPERFWALAVRTGRTIELSREGVTRPLGPIVDPVGLTHAIQAGETATLTRRQSDDQTVRAPLPTNTETQTIVPGVRVGPYTLGMSKDEILRKLGEPKSIHAGGEKYTLENLPQRYILSYGEIAFGIDGNAVTGITALGPSYKFTGGLGVGDLVDSITQAFGSDFQLRELDGRDILTYEDKGLSLEVSKSNRAVMEVNIFQAKRRKTDSPGILKTLPRYDPNSDNPFQVDLRGRDLSKLDLRASLDDLQYASFDDRTVWPAPERMPAGFDWRKIMELGKNPGLSVRRLHERGITGRGVRIAIIDQPLLVGHQEYADRLRLYEEVDLQGRTKPAMHGAAVASIALGKTVGVAPEAELYYIARPGGLALQRLARCVRRIVEVNAQLPKDNKIRVISMSTGWVPSHEGYKEIMDAVQKAQAAGIMTVCVHGPDLHAEFDLRALGRSPWADPDVFESYQPGIFLTKSFWTGPSSSSGDSLWVPMDARTTASPAGTDQYVFCGIGGMSWAVPYVAGVYALAVQVDPAITPERFWALALRTGRTIELNRNGVTRRLGPIIDPVELIHALQAGEAATLSQ